MLNDYNEAVKCVEALIHALDCAMVRTHAMGFQGQKRQNRKFANILSIRNRQLKCEVFDKHHTPVEHHVHKMPVFTVIDIKDYAHKYRELMADAAARLTAANAALIAKGRVSKELQRIMKHVDKLKEKAARFYDYGVDVAWCETALKTWDKLYHDQLKHKERELYGHIK